MGRGRSAEAARPWQKSSAHSRSSKSGHTPRRNARRSSRSTVKSRAFSDASRPHCAVETVG
eukprot:4247631-Prymnesium_polylepis.1